MHTLYPRTDILEPRGSCFVLEGVLSPSECAHFIREAERIANDGKAVEVATEYRKTRRVAAASDELAALLYNRVGPHLNPRLKIKDNRCSEERGVPDAAEGIWEPYGLNELFRICRYAPGGLFLPHTDKVNFVHPVEDRSLKTLMVYLNGELDGG